MNHILSTEELEQYGDYIPEMVWLGYDHKPSEIGDFENDALQPGWSREQLLELKEGRLQKVDTNGLKPFLQSWFSIGLYEMALGKGLERDGFVTSGRNSGILSFTSEPLRQLLADLCAKLQELPSNDGSKVETLERLVRVLASASVWNRMLTDPELFIRANPEFCDETYHNVMQLLVLSAVALEYIANYLAEFAQGNFRPRLQNAWQQTDRNKNHLQQKLVKRGWCPYIQLMLSPFNILVSEYAAIVGPPSTRFAHNSCSTHRCVRHNIDDRTYKPIHIREGCQCTSVRPNLASIAKILENGQIPLVDFNRVSQSGQGKTVQVVAFEEGKVSFTAVSHVWSGGLGSTSEEGLPECAVDFLASKIGSGANSKLAWIDSLCIPLEKRLRKMSIMGMNSVYSQAANTLVLDPELLHSNSANTRSMLLWITTAAWMQRMWTLPEGRLSQLRLVAFKDRVVRLAELIQDADKNEHENPVSSPLMSELFGLLFQSPNMLRHVHQSLCFRTTSHREDEVPALAALFGINPSRILETKSLDERMALFWIALREKVNIPMNILFLRGEKLPIPGLRWAPRTLLNAGKQPSLLGPPPGVRAYNGELSDNGTLTANYVVIHLDKRSNFVLNEYNPIKLAFIPGPGPVIMGLTPFSLLVSETVANIGDCEPSQTLEDIDALAVNITNLDAKAGYVLGSEFTAARRSAVALTIDSPGEQDRNSHSFRARRRVEVWPLETRGDNPAVGYVGWARISIS